MRLLLPPNATPAIREAHADLAQELARAKTLARTVRDSQDEIYDRLSSIGTSFVTGGITGWYQGAYGDTVRWGLPTTTWAAIAMGGLGGYRLFKSNGRDGHMLINAAAGVGIVSLAGWIAKKAYEERIAREKGGGAPANAPGQAAAGAAAIGQRMSDADLSQFANVFA